MTPERDVVTEALPRLSVVIATEDFSTIRQLVGCLTVQSIVGELELVVVCPARAAFRLPAESAEAFGQTQVVEHALVPPGEARGAGIRAAQSRLVVLAETCAFPARWAEHLVGAHAGGWVAVMPAVENANAGSALSWSAYLVDYGPWAPNGASAEIADPPSYHASFERDPRRVRASARSAARAWKRAGGGASRTEQTFLGYVAGEGDSSAQMAEYELHKARYLRRSDGHDGPRGGP